MADEPPKRPKLHPRDGAGSFKIENPDDGTPIREMITLPEALLIITDKCTYRIQLADQIDPKRENPSLPHNFQQRLFDHGVLSELLCKTLIQAKVLLHKDLQKINVEQAMQHTLEALSNLISMDHIAREFSATQQTAIAKLGLTNQNNRSAILPAVGSAREQFKSFVQMADHFSAALLKIMRLYFPNASGWESVRAAVKSKFGEEDPYYKYCESIGPALQLVRDMRNALEHDLPGVVVRDFEAQSNGTVLPPTVEVNVKKSKLERVSLSNFMSHFVGGLSSTFELVITYTCGAFLQPFSGMPILVYALPEEYRKARRASYGYGIRFADGQIAPFG